MSGLFLVLGFLFMYFIPALEAHRRRHRNARAIAVLNFFLGWTVLGWIGAFIWASTANTEGKVRYE